MILLDNRFTCNLLYKASGADHGTKVNVINANRHKYSISAIFTVLKIPRATYYYVAKQKEEQDHLIQLIIEIFRISRNNYGTRKIKKELAKQDLVVSRRRIGRIMKQEGLVSNYTVAQFRPHTAKCNEDKIENIVDRKFNDQPMHHVVVSDLTYVRVGMSWNYIGLLIDLFNREIIGYSAG